MILGIGIDIVEISRVSESLISKILSPEEIDQRNGYLSEKRQKEYLAGRFAVKEAIKKAFQSYDGFSGMDDLVVLNDEAGKPYLKSPSFSDKTIHLSLSHEREYAIGFCVVEKKEI
ncbi:MAG: holo-ACP synthase [Firmicutes bacterium]|nr:holo-ACP synthase [Bacillota bacterium]